MSEREYDLQEWVEIVEPSSLRHIFANLVTGECSRAVPVGACVKKYSNENDQWWELLDKKTKKFYYYNVATQTTVWHKPAKGDIIPLTKLQTEMSEEHEDFRVFQRETHSSEPMKHRRTASARISCETQPSMCLPASRICLNHSQQIKGKAKVKEGCWDGIDCVGQNLYSDMELNYPAQGTACQHLIKGEDLSDPWLQQNFDKGKDCILNDSLKRNVENLWNSPDVIPNSKPNLLKQTGEIEQIFQNESSVMSLDEKLSKFDSDPTRCSTLLSCHLSLDSGITDDVSSAYSAVSYSSVAHLCSEDHVPHEGFQKSSSHIRQINSADEKLCSQDSLELTFAPTVYECQRRPFPRTNPKFVRSQRTSFQKTNSSLNQNVTDDLISQFSVLLCNEKHDHDLLSSSKQPDVAFHGKLSVKNNKNNSIVQANTDVSAKAIVDFASKSNISSRSCSDSATCHTSFLYHKFPSGLSDPSTDQIRSLDSVISSYDNYEKSCFLEGSEAKQKASDIAHFSDVEHQQPNTGMKLFEKGHEMDEHRRTRRNSEPDYANIQETEVQGSFNNRLGKVKQSESNQFASDRKRQVQTKAEAIYANEHLTGRGCLTHEDRFHIPSLPGQLDGSLGCSDNSTVLSPLPKLHRRVTRIAAETRHMSLRRKKITEKTVSETSRNFIDKSRSLHSELCEQRPLSTDTSFGPEMDTIVCQVADTLIQRADMEQFIVENLNEHRKGLLGKAVPIANMLIWTKDPIQKPMIRTDIKMVKKEAPEIFRLIQTFMGDRKSKESSSFHVLELVNKGWNIPELQDEIYVQLCRQTTKNSRDESLLRGWELLAICLSFFPPSSKFRSYLEGHIFQTLDSHDHTEGSKLHGYAKSCLQRLEKICQTKAKHKPSPEELERSRKSLLEPSLFGNTLDDVMDFQKGRFPNYQLPWIQVTLSEALLNCKGNQLPEGIFRVPSDVDEVNALRVKCDKWEVPDSHTDPHVLASVLKLWYRELHEPLIPDDFYDDCIDNFDSPSLAVAVVRQLPPRNMLVLTYLIRFLQIFASSEYVAITKMDASNLAMVMAPNCLRCLKNNPQLLFENARKEMSFIRTLIQHLDTSFIDWCKIN